MHTSAPSPWSASLYTTACGAPPGDEPQERLSPRLNRPQAHVLAVTAQKIERQQRGLRSAALGQERMEVAAPVVLEDDRLAVDQRLIPGKAADRFSMERR
jgi:hypothetical protein